MILYIWWLQIWKQIWMICTSNVINFPLSLLNLLCSSIFIWIFTILHNQRIQIFQQIRTICTSNIHNFPLSFLSMYIWRTYFSIEFSLFCTFNKIKFLNKFRLSVHLMYTFTIWYIHWFSIKFSRISTFN